MIRYKRLNEGSISVPPVDKPVRHLEESVEIKRLVMGFLSNLYNTVVDVADSQRLPIKRWRENG